MPSTVTAIIEKSVRLVFGDKQLHRQSACLRLPPIGLCFRVHLVRGAEEENRGRHSGDGFGLRQAARIEEHHRSRFGTGCQERHRTGAASGAAAGRQLRWVDPLFPGMGLEPGEGRLAVNERIFFGCVVLALDAVLGAGGDHTSTGQIAGFGIELPCASVDEATAEKEDDAGPRVRGLPAVGIEHRHL